MFMLLVALCLLLHSSEAGILNTLYQMVGKSLEIANGMLNPQTFVSSNSCISDLGCFDTGPPFFDPIHRPVSVPPSNRTDLIRFLLFTPNNKTEAYQLKPDKESVRKCAFVSGLKTTVLIHGFLVTLDKDDVRYRMKDTILGIGEYNVIIVDWTQLSGQPYSQAVANSRMVGALIAKLLRLLMEVKGVKAESFYLIGHSLGAQTAGYAGERIQNVGRITGLDPAGPGFQQTDSAVQLDPTDALFVDVIHTDGIETIGLGTVLSSGHMDFYPNGGRQQPGCPYNSQTNNLIGNAIKDMIHLMKPTCDHSRANELFLESIDDSRCKFLAVRCANYTDYEAGLCPPGKSAVAEMGFHNRMVEGLGTPPPAKFYLKTNGERPFCKEDSIRIEVPVKKN